MSASNVPNIGSLWSWIMLAAARKVIVVDAQKPQDLVLCHAFNQQFGRAPIPLQHLGFMNTIFLKFSFKPFVCVSSCRRDLRRFANPSFSPRVETQLVGNNKSDADDESNPIVSKKSNHWAETLPLLLSDSAPSLLFLSLTQMIERRAY